ncbi:peptide/nickel transport system permease protein [Oceanotoga teriensis]|jgi:peptide/nickel transport system permease protein|uniref:Peptide/nickel transport system permease protein n=1 Tax=Oceanotoga teriensis TaxID=515440 RepID=A0AA45C8H7_9BACT|nr:peptide/nickel transport system permease protein [Oceanotoga teriensis]
MVNKEEVKRTLKKLFSNTGAIVGFILVSFFIVIAILAPIIQPPDIPQDSDLSNIKQLIDEGDLNNRETIIGNFKGFQDLYFGFYMMDFDTIKSLKNDMDSYKKGDLSFEELKGTINDLTDLYIIDISYSTLIEENTEQAIKNLEEEYKRYERNYNMGVEYQEKIEKLEKLEDNKFLSQSKKLYDEFQSFYINNIQFDPYIMPLKTLQNEPQPPSKEHPFGISNGRDIFYGVVWGTRTAFKIGLSVVTVATLVGLFIGSVSAYFGGWVDEVLMRITDIFLSIPFILSAMVLTSILGTGIDKVMIAMMVFTWMATARLIRGNILQEKNEQYVSAARALGVPNWKIIIKHILPNTIFPVVIQATMRIGSMVITASGLSFLGLGAPQGYADWGSILSYARNWMLGGGSNALQYWYTVVFPGVAMILFVLGWNLVGDALRDIFDPKNRM